MEHDVVRKIRRHGWNVLLLTLGLTVLSDNDSPAEPWEDDPQQHILVDAKFRRWRAETPFGSYRPRKTRVVSLLPNYAPAEDQSLCEHGGRPDITLQATGFFRVERVDGRWWLVDPHGHPFFATSLNSIRSGQRKDRNATSVSAFAEKWKSETAWAGDATAFMRESGFNTVGAWSDPSLQAIDRPMPWMKVLYVMYPFGAQRGAQLGENNMSFPNQCIPIFDPEFEAYCEQKLADDITSDLVNDPTLLGYCVDNELPWREDALDRYLQIDTTDINHKAAVEWLVRAKGLDPAPDLDQLRAAVDDSDRSAFLAHIAERYFSIVSRVVRAQDPNHLYLGARLHGQALRLEPVLRVSGTYADIVSINYYNRWTPRASELDNWSTWSGGKPFMITEWYAKGDDSGYENVSGAGMVVKTQAERGHFYQNFLLRLLESKSCVGSFWHTYRDAKERPDGSNKGFLNVSFDPYTDLVERAAEINRQKYGLIDYFDR